MESKKDSGIARRGELKMGKDKVELASEAFEKTRRSLNNFITKNASLYKKYQTLIGKYNAARKEVELLLKERLANSSKPKDRCGMFSVLKKSTNKWDGEKLVKLFSSQVKGIVVKRTVYEVDIKALNKAIKDGVIDNKKVQQALIQKPPTIALSPGCPKEIKLGEWE
jgi:hypothetical protein